MQGKITIPQSFAIVDGSASPFGFKEYKVCQKYEDPLKMVDDRAYANGKMPRPMQKATKRGSFLVDETKLHKYKPGPGRYKLKTEWS